MNSREEYCTEFGARCAPSRALWSEFLAWRRLHRENTAALTRRVGVTIVKLDWPLAAIARGLLRMRLKIAKRPVLRVLFRHSELPLLRPRAPDVARAAGAYCLATRHTEMHYAASKPDLIFSIGEARAGRRTLDLSNLILN